MSFQLCLYPYRERLRGKRVFDRCHFSYNTTVDAIALGKEADVTTGFGTDNLGTFELQFSPLVSAEKPVKFRVKVKANSSDKESSSSSNTPSANSGSKVKVHNQMPSKIMWDKHLLKQPRLHQIVLMIQVTFTTL